MTYHTILKTSSDFIDGLRHAREICDTINKDMNLTKHQSEVFPYRWVSWFTSELIYFCISIQVSVFSYFILEFIYFYISN